MFPSSCRNYWRVNLFAVPRLTIVLAACFFTSCASPIKNTAHDLPESFIRLVDLLSKEEKPSIDVAYGWQMMFPSVKKLSHHTNVLDSGGIAYLLEDRVQICISYLGNQITLCEILQILTIPDDYPKEKYIASISDHDDLRETSWEVEAPSFNFGDKELINKLFPLFIKEHLSPMVGAAVKSEPTCLNP